MVTLLESNTTYKRILHLSDLHIRTGDPDRARYKQYAIVFKHFIETIQEMDLSETLTVITGDVFHHKGKIEPAGLRLTHQLFQALLNKTPVVVICGNHDYRQDDPSIPDMIETVLTHYPQKYPLYYLNQTGHYHVGNVGFGVVDVRDTLKQYNTRGRVESLPSFPSPKELNTPYKIALFHGSVMSQSMIERFKSYQGYPLEWFSGYPMVLLGDIHKKQVNRTLTSDQVWGYPGSLIQQDFGESWDNHGFLMWDLETRQAQFHPVYNPYGMCTIKQVDQIVYVHSHKKEWHALSDIYHFPMFPKEPMIRWMDSDIASCETALKPFNIHPSRIQSWCLEEPTQTSLPSTDPHLHYLDELNTPSKWVDYLQHICGKDYREWILHPEHLKLPEAFQSFRKYQERNDKIQKVIDTYQQERKELVRSFPRVELKHMTWNYLMCYGENNQFDFDPLQGNIALLNGKNAMGKSSFLDILCIALYGKPTKMRHVVTGKKYTDKILHDRRPHHQTPPSVKLLLTLQGKLFEIHRVFGIQSTKHKEHSIMQKEVVIYEIRSEAPIKIAEGNTSVERWVETHIGTMDSILMSTMMCQLDLNNFFHQKQEDQKEILDTALHLENVSLYGKILKESILAHQDLFGQVKTLMESIPSTPTLEPIDFKELQKCESQWDKWNQQKDYWMVKMPSSGLKTTVPESIETDYVYAKDAYELQFDSKRFQELESTLHDAIRLEERLEHLRERYQPYESDVIYKDSAAKLEKWLKKKEVFMKQKPIVQTTLEWMEQTKQQYQVWLSKHSETYPSLEALENERLQWMNEPIPKPISKRPVSIDPSYVDRWDETIYQTQLEAYQFHQSQKRDVNETMDQYNAWCQTYESWLQSRSTVHACTEKDRQKHRKNHEKLQKAIEAQKEWKALERELEKGLEEYERLQAFTFNPNCHACQSNPIRQKKQEMEDRHIHLTTYCEQMKGYFKKIKLSSCLTTLEELLEQETQWLQEDKEYQFEKEFYEKEKEAWRDIYQRLQDQAQWQEKDTLLRRYFQEQEMIKRHWEWHHYESWNQGYQAFLTKETIIRTYWREKQEWENTLTYLREQEEQWQRWTIWNEEEGILNQKIQQFERSLEKQRLQKELQACQTEYQDKQALLSEWKILKSLQDTFKHQESLYAISKVQEALQKLQSLQTKKETLTAKHLKYQHQQEAYESQQKQTQQYQSLFHLLETRLNELKQFETAFMGDKTQSDGYKEWIYTQKVIPLLNQEMNTFLGLFEEFRFQMIYENKQFIYLLNDRGNQPTLDKASGYQNFIINIAFRLALTRIGAVGQQLKHLFIDEGFTACDVNNIEKIPLLLQSMMTYGNYHSILLMSHLDSVRECTQQTITIERKDPFSKIQFGSPYPSWETDIKRKKK